MFPIFDPKRQVTLDSLHSTLRIVGKMIQELEEEAKIIDQELAMANLALKLAEENLEIFKQYSSDVEEQISEREAFFDKTSQDSLDKAHLDDDEYTLDLKLQTASKYVSFQMPVYNPPAEYDDSNDVSRFIIQVSGQERLLLQCSACQKTYASKASITKHLQLFMVKPKSHLQKKNKN